MRDLNPLNDKQKAELATMPAAYNDMALAMNNDLLETNRNQQEENRIHR